MGAGFPDKEDAMKCFQCDGEMELKNVTYTVDRKGYHLFLQEIPAYVCTRCGERFFDEQEVAAMQKMLSTLEKDIDYLRKSAA